ncbi:methylated-DNA--[protein]-cysteine S-methyltransferase [Dysgonomonas sp. Marseille-P4361]|uniref:methylated-DNA--[protein]-cysteine S-methyltransferase n=1 Tax=Dysgonomonas sp. Marseille-P4361 TaxID=2161820 RepID=UPI000D56168B|nr:methylated-DNA--[protein]-cysteine S-methyltransferase [Dysgonomonas sp. Marseille-P4361]
MKAFYQSPVGVIEIEETNNHISSITILTEQPPNTPSEISPLLNDAIQQFEEYFDGKRKSFDLPLKQEGTDFQRKAWSYLKTIPYGETVSYKDQASAIGSPKAFRAVGSANGRNKLAIIVPCHRVINERNGLGGYAYGLDIKRLLLELELFYKEQNNA